MHQEMSSSALNGDIMVKRDILDYWLIIIFWFIILLCHIKIYRFIGLKHWLRVIFH